MPEKTAVQISVAEEGLDSLLKPAFLSKGWSEFKVESKKLSYKNYWLFNYNSFAHGKEVSETASGSSALNASTGALEEAIAETINENKMEHAKPGVEIERRKINEEEARKLAALKIASNLKAKKANIVVSAFELVQVPFWFASVSFNSHSAALIINASTSEILNEGKIPEKPKSWKDAAKETASDLKKPKSWLAYSAGLLRTIASSRLGSAFLSLLKKRRVQIAIVIVIAVYILFLIT